MKHCISQVLSGAVLTIFILFTTACSPKHYTLARGNTLSLYFRQAKANKVIFASSIDQYQYHPATIAQDGVWEVTVPIQNEFAYFYIVDDVVTLPDCQQTVKDDFGSRNCLFVSSM